MRMTWCDKLQGHCDCIKKLNNTEEKIGEQKEIIHDIENENHYFKRTIYKLQNQLIKSVNERNRLYAELNG